MLPLLFPRCSQQKRTGLAGCQYQCRVCGIQCYHLVCQDGRRIHFVEKRCAWDRRIISNIYDQGACVPGDYRLAGLFGPSSCLEGTVWILQAIAFPHGFHRNWIDSRFHPFFTRRSVVSSHRTTLLTRARPHERTRKRPICECNLVSRGSYHKNSVTAKYLIQCSLWYGV